MGFYCCMHLPNTRLFFHWSFVNFHCSISSNPLIFPSSMKLLLTLCLNHPPSFNYTRNIFKDHWSCLYQDFQWFIYPFHSSCTYLHIKTKKIIICWHQTFNLPIFYTFQSLFPWMNMMTFGQSPHHYVFSSY
jgi:hypothetical protein